MLTPEYPMMASSYQYGEELEELESLLFECAMKGNWDLVIKAYETTPMALRAKITKSRDTALHVAVSSGRSDIAMKLLEVVYNNQCYDILAGVNIEGNTPLHLAAAQGDLQVCKKIALTSTPLLGARNNKGETPLFLAASHGKEETFFFLHSHFPKEQLLRSADGNTVLHIGISHDYFRMALKIIEIHPHIAEYFNEDGQSPLHILANKPNAFRSSTHLWLYDKSLYYFVDAFEDEETYNFKEEEEDSQKDENSSSKNYPENFNTCMLFIKQLRRVFPKFVRSPTMGIKCDRRDDNKADEEEQSDRNKYYRRDDIEAYGKEQSGKKVEKHKAFPPNYDSCVLFFKLILKVLLVLSIVVLQSGIWRLNKIRNMRRQHKLAEFLMNKLVSVSTRLYAPESDPTEIMGDRHAEEWEEIHAQFPAEVEKKKHAQLGVSLIPQGSRSLRSSPILIAAKAGIVEIIEKTLENVPKAIQDVDSLGKNVVLLAVEKRQPHVYHRLVELNKKKFFPKDVFSQVDNEGNSALHLAAIISDTARQSSLVQGSMLQMQREIKWYEFVKNSMPANFFPLFNRERQTAREIFLITHESLMIGASEWFFKTSESCSVVAALVASVAFATASTVPGGIKPDSGAPTLADKPAFISFAISSLFALCSSVTALGFFLAILTSRNRYQEFTINLPRKLLLAFTFLFISIVSMLVSFFEGHTFVLKDELRDVSYPLYATLCFPLAVYASSLLSLYVELLWSTFQRIPEKNVDIYN